MTRTKLIVANWKMNHTIPEALKFFAGLSRELRSTISCEVVICPPFTGLYAMTEALEGTIYKLGAQNMHWEENGPFTGEVSPVFLRDLNVQYVILGHSERRRHFGETDAGVNKKLAAALKYYLTPIVCVGETAEDRRAEKTREVVEGQMKRALDGLMRSELTRLTWAYEPIWAIGTGKNAAPEQAEEVARWMRDLCAKAIDAPAAEVIRILYGGSVSEEKAAGFLGQPNIDGLLVGGASLDPKSFAAIVRAVPSS